MTSLVFVAPGATIRAADTARRTITGRVLTYGEYGNTSAGRKRFRAGSLELPTDTPTRVLLLRGHTAPDGRVQANGDGEQAGAAVRLADDDEKLDAEFRVTALPIGDVLLAEADPACPIRAGLSVEVHDVEYDPADPDTVIRARLSAVAAVPFQAYPSSRMTSVAASAHNPTGEPSVTAAPETVAPAAAPAEPAAPAIDYGQLAAALAPQLAQLTAAAAPAGLPTGALPSPGLAPSAAPAVAEDDVIGRAAQLQAAVFQGTADPSLRAALVDVTNTGMPLFQAPGALGEKLWEGASFTRQFVPLMRQKQLTSWKFSGWQWVQRPRVQNYTGDKAEVPSNPIKVAQREYSATRLAGAWDIDRKFVDFNDPEFWAEFWAAGTESYLEESDLRAAAAIVSYAIDVTNSAGYPTGDFGYTPPAGYEDGAGGLLVAQADVLRAAALATAVLEDTPRVRRAPDYIVMNTADWLGLSELTNLDLPAFLALLKVRPENFMRSALVEQGTIIAGVTPAATFRELGSVPIRVEALDVAHGGVDRGLFGYTGISMDRPGGIISVPLAGAGA